MRTLDFTSLSDYMREHHHAVAQGILEDEGWSLADVEIQALLGKLRQIGIPLSEYINHYMYYGIKTEFNEAFVIGADTRDKLIGENPASAEIIKPLLIGRDIKRYQPPNSDKYLIFTRRGIDIKKYPAIERHLSSFKERLLPKPPGWEGDTWKGRKPGPYKWYEIQE